MRRLALTIRYDGRNYCGYQIQPNVPTIAGAVQDALEKIFKDRLHIIGCSRTDAGVHANNYCLTFDTDNKIPCDKVVIALNTVFPDDIAAIYCEDVLRSFHPRKSACGKRYIYRVYDSKIRNPFYRGYAYHCSKGVDEVFLNNECKDFVGTFDYIAFSNSGGADPDKIKTITHCEVKRNGDIVEFIVEGSGFLYNMVRIMVGTLLDIDRKKIVSGTIPDIIASRKREKAGVTAPAYGLYLDKVFY